jgi:hypothetical protein
VDLPEPARELARHLAVAALARLRQAAGQAAADRPGRYRPVVRDQAFLLPPHIRQWLPDDHPVWLVIAAMADHLDTRALHAARRTSGAAHRAMTRTPANRHQ